MQQSAIHQRNKKYIYYSCTSRQKKIVYACIPRTTVVIFNRSDAVETATPTLWRPAGALLEHQDQGHCSATTRRIAPHQQWSRTLRGSSCPNLSLPTCSAVAGLIVRVTIRKEEPISIVMGIQPRHLQR